MSAMCFLYAGKANPPSWTEYEEDETALFESNYLVPVFWLALFSCRDLTTYLDEDAEFDDPSHNSVPLLVGNRKVCLELLGKRSELLIRHFPASRAYLEGFIARITKAKGKLVSLNISELYACGDPDEFKRDLKNALLFFDNNDVLQIHSVLKMADVQTYNGVDFIPSEKDAYSYHLFGTASD